jgi:ABC-type methionine transport system ATPase subunit
MKLHERIGVTEAALQEYLALCDQVFQIPGGYMTRRGDVLHIFAPVNGLSGRKLIQSCKQALESAHKHHARLTCPIPYKNSRAMRFVQHFGFQSYHRTETHVWFQHFVKEAP